MTPAGGQLADEDRDMRLKAQMKHAGEPGHEHSEEEHEVQLKAAKKGSSGLRCFYCTCLICWSQVQFQSSLGPVY